VPALRFTVTAPFAPVHRSVKGTPISMSKLELTILTRAEVSERIPMRRAANSIGFMM
jgi:hypothetical protein